MENPKTKAVVFGGAGFLGSHVADILSDRGYQVVIFDLKKSPYLKEGQISLVGDITDEKAVEEALQDCQVVYNFAAIADMDEAKEKPLNTIKSNILGNTVLLEAAIKNNVKRFVFASTLYVYSNTGSFYRSSKQACESIIENYHEIYGLDHTILRYGSLYGPRSSEDNWVHRILKQAIVEGKITRPGDGEEIRDYIHVHDAARLSCDVLNDEYKNQHVIIAGNQAIKIKDSLEMIKEMFNKEIELEFLPKTTLTGHYKITPYAFTPKLAKRIQGNHYVDFGQGILDLINQLYKKYSPHKKKDGFYTKD
ncbi:MAG: NAD-dependent epimerase [Parcubacteria group bacterium]|nr:NAD-dependent epimerase [Parcubacteria group bacterium]